MALVIVLACTGLHREEAVAVPVGNVSLNVEALRSGDIARDLLDPDCFVATGVYEDGAALERQESAPEVHTAMAMFADSLAAPPDRRIYDAVARPDPRLNSTRTPVMGCTGESRQ